MKTDSTISDNNTQKTPFRSGFVSIIGAPNVGKSTLINRVLGQKISITSQKPQTTRDRILGIVHRPTSQMVLIDTPGVHEATGTLNKRMVDIAMSALSEADLILFMADATEADLKSEQVLLNAFKQGRKDVILALNKIDLIKKPVLLEQMDLWIKRYTFKTIVPISAKTGTQVKELLDTMETALPEGPPYFPKEDITDVPERVLVAELIREKVFRLTGQEIPYSTVVTVDTFSLEKKKSLIKIHANIHVERKSQKGIIIGKGGSKLKTIGEAARKDIEQMTGHRVFLKLFVQVQKNWSRDPRALRRFGYERIR